MTLALSVLAHGQTALYNSGNLQQHANGQLGFHTNLINDGSFDDNVSLTGFYGTGALTVSGAFMPQFFDMELLVDNGLFLETGLGVRNNLNFIAGDVVTPKNNKLVYLDFKQEAFFTGENDAAKVDGYAAVTNRSFFSFPVGDAVQLRPLLLESDRTNEFALCAYFSEDPNNPASINDQFFTDEKVRDIGEISTSEFWVLEADASSTITISWNQFSNLGALANGPEDLIVVGWNIAASQWVILGNTAFGGDINQGFITSEKFVPNNFAALTFGTIPLPLDTFAVNNPTLGDYFLSPDGDGINDFLVIEGMEESPNNSLLIFNRFGQKVFEKINYVDEFTGISNMTNLVINKEIGLPEGVYFYVATLNDLELEYQGFLFLNR